MTGPLQSPRKLLDALGRAASERRISVWSASPADQKLLEETPLAHMVPDDDAPYAQVIINNLAGNKMDYYLKREIEYAADGCDGDMRNSTVTVRLTNTADADRAAAGVRRRFSTDLATRIPGSNAPTRHHGVIGPVDRHQGRKTAECDFQRQADIRDHPY